MDSGPPLIFVLETLTKRKTTLCLSRQVAQQEQLTGQVNKVKTKRQHKQEEERPRKTRRRIQPNKQRTRLTAIYLRV